MEFSQDEFDEILEIFSEESDEIIHRIDNNILSLEKDPQNKDILIELFRDAHSLKGAARMIGFNDIQLLAHKIEDILGLAKDGKILIKEAITDALYKAMDFVNLTIQLSVKAKKEIKSDEYLKYIEMLDNVINSHNSDGDVINAEVKTKSSEEQFVVESSDFLKQLIEKSGDVNAELAESIFLIEKLEETLDLNFVMSLLYNIDLLKNVFKSSSNSELLCSLNKIISKLEFVIKEKIVIDLVEVEKIKQELNVVVKIITNLFEQNNIEIVDFNKLLGRKLSANDASQDISELKDTNIRKESISLIKNIIASELSASNLGFVIGNVDRLIELNKNQPLKVILDKISNVLNLMKTSEVGVDNNVVSIFNQNLQLVIKMLENDGAIEAKDIDLVVQSLEIVGQMVGLKSPDVSYAPQVDASKNGLAIVEQSLNMQGQDVFKIFESTAIKTLRVDTQKLDKLVNQIGEVIISKIKTQKHIIELDQINNRLLDLYDFALKTQNYFRYYDRKLPQSDNKYDTKVLANFNRQVLSYLEESQLKLNEEIQNTYKLHKRMQEDDAKLNLVVNKLEQMVKDIRLLPLATVFHMIPRMVRDIAKEKNKEVDLTISGSETNADKKIIEEIKTPLVHIIRNAIDHGIETPEERIAQGKEPVGKISLSAKHNANKIIIEVADNGRGVNLEKIKQKAINKGLLTFEELNSMKNEQIMNLIFWPGFTTEDTVTDISGRGIGLDVVQTKISQLNGKVKVESIVSKGTRVTIELPVTMATIKSFIIKLNSQSYAIPVSAIKSVTKISPEDIYQKDGKDCILYHQISVPIYNLAQILGFDSKDINNAAQTVLLIEAENALVGLVVEELEGDQEILNKELAPPLFKLKNISGITTLVNGDICLILNVSELLKTIMTGEYKPLSPLKMLQEEKENTHFPENYKILVVDDFMTTRIMLKNILVAKGYQVDVAVGANEALEMFGFENYDLVISDIEMPKMNGYELVEKIRSITHKSNVPVILISSLVGEAQEDKVHNCGANMYVDKNQFDQKYFLASVEYLIKQRMENS